MKHISKTTLWVSKGLEVLHWIAQLTMIAVLVCIWFNCGWINKLLAFGISECGPSLSTYGFEVMVANSEGHVHITALVLFMIGSIIILGFMAMSCRNVYLIVKKAEQTTPFQKDTIRMVREIGIFIASIPTIGLIMSILIRIIAGVDGIETSVNISGFVIGILLLCLTQFFARGAQLEHDMDGLL